VMANFAGIASSLELFGVSRYVSVPLGAAAVWLLVVKGTYERIEKAFLLACVVYVSYIASGLLVGPDWKQAAIDSVIRQSLAAGKAVGTIARDGEHAKQLIDKGVTYLAGTVVTLLGNSLKQFRAAVPK